MPSDIHGLAWPKPSKGDYFLLIVQHQTGTRVTTPPGFKKVGRARRVGGGILETRFHSSRPRGGTFGVEKCHAS